VGLTRRFMPNPGHMFLRPELRAFSFSDMCIRSQPCARPPGAPARSRRRRRAGLCGQGRVGSLKITMFINAGCPIL
jgi:hypothetical protein